MADQKYYTTSVRVVFDEDMLGFHKITITCSTLLASETVAARLAELLAQGKYRIEIVQEQDDKVIKTITL